MAEYLPPVVTVFTGDISDLIAKVQAARAAMASLKGDTGTFKISVDTSGLAGAATAIKGVTDATNTARIGVGAFGLTWVGWLKLIHYGLMIFGAQIISDTIGIAAFGLAAVHTLGPVFGAINNLGKAWNDFSGAQKVAAVNLNNFMNSIHGNDIQVVTVFDRAIQLLSSHMHQTGGIVDQAANAFLHFETQISGLMNSTLFKNFLGSHAGTIQTDLSALFTLITRLGTALISLAHNFNFLGLWALSGIGMVLKAITWLNTVNPGLARVAFLTLAAYHALKLLIGSAIVQGIIRIATAIKAAWEASAAWTATLGGSRFMSFIQLLTGAGAATVLLAAGLTAVFSAVAAGVGLAILVGTKYADTNLIMIHSMAQVDHATGLNIAGYQKLSGQLKTTIVNLQGTEKGMVLVGAAGARYQSMLNQDIAAQRQAATTASTLQTNFGYLEQRFGLTQLQAYQLAKQLGLLSTIGKQVFTPNQRANINAYMNTIRQSNNPMTALRYDMGQAANTALTLTDRIQGLQNAFNALLSPLANSLQAAVTWKNDNLALEKAVRASSGAIGLQTAAARTSQAALSTSLTDTINYSNAQAAIPGHMNQAISVIRQEIAILKGLHSQSTAVKTALHDLQAQLDALHNKTVTLTFNTIFSQTGSPPPLSGTTQHALGIPSPQQALGPGSQTSFLGGTAVIHSQVFLDGKQVYQGVQQRALRRSKLSTFNGLTRVIR